jgi:hypothetical protein
MKLELSPQVFRKNTRISNLMIIRSVEADVFHVGGRTEMMQLVIALRQLAKARKAPYQTTSPVRLY